MKKYFPNNLGYFCGDWTGNNLEIKVSRGKPVREKFHCHNFSEYYLVTSGSVTLRVKGKSIELKEAEMLEVESGEEHGIINKSNDYCLVIIKPVK
jgi:mannose-6-phosphate isomerase-like protein (cupin superfamily)